MKNNINLSPVHVTVHSDNTKMEGLKSTSTSTKCNKQCRKNMLIEGSICQKCFADSTLDRRDYLALALERNYNLLTTRILEDHEVLRLNDLYHRFEAFGDLANTTQFINYINMCNANPHTMFAIWTKNPHIMSEVLNDMQVEKPKNLIIVVSSLFLNVEWKYKNLPYANKYWFIDKVFTVYTADYAIKNNIKINCGNKKCLQCKLCYTHNNITVINEIIKSQANTYYNTLAMLNDYKEWLQENELQHNAETLETYISSLYYELCDSYEGKHENWYKWIKTQEKKIKKTILKYIEYVL